MASPIVSEEQLIEALHQRGLVTSEQSQHALEQQGTAFLQAQMSIAGIAFLVDLTLRELIIREYPTDKEIKRIPLVTGLNHSGFNPHDWQRWGSHLVVLNPEDGNRMAEYDWQTGALYGLVVSRGKTYLYNEGRLDVAFLAQSHQLIFGGVYSKGMSKSAPYDLTLSDGGRWLCVSDRAAGNVMILDAWNYEIKGIVNLREAGRSQCLNLAIDESRDQIYISDNHNAGLQILNLRSLEVKRERLPYGILGNLTLSSDGRHLYILSLKPEEKLLCLNPDTWEEEKSLKLKGHLFKSNSDDPCDLISLSPDGKSLLVMTYLNDPEPFTPVITVIDTKQNKALRRYSFKDGIKPFQLTFAYENPVKAYTKSYEELIIQDALIDAASLWALKRELQMELGGTATEQAALAAKQMQKPIQEVAPIQIDAAYWQDAEQRLSTQPQKRQKITLPPEAIDEILDILVFTFEKQIDEEISGYPDVLKRLRDAATQARDDLEAYDSTVVQIDELFEGHHLQTAVLRDAVLTMLDLKETVKQAPVKAVPDHCPNCKQSLLGSWDCPACGFELESPDRAFKRRIASADAIANLPLGHVLVPDPQGLRLLQLNPYKYIVWDLAPDQLSLDYPVDALWMPNGHVLTADKDGHQVMELGRRGKIFWRYDTKRSEHHRLKEPAKVTYYFPIQEHTVLDALDMAQIRFLIVDQGNHRVIEVNRQHDIVIEFGVQGESGTDAKHLNSPSDVQFTHDETYLITDTGNDRILEFRKQSLERVFGPELGLKRPTSAQRLFNDHTLIVDSGNYRLLELDARGQIVFETLYFTRGIDPKFRVVSPLKMIRLINKDVMILDEDKLIQVRLADKKLIWYSMIEDLAFQPRVDGPEIVIDENGEEQRVYKPLDHGRIKPVRLSQKINFKRMQKLIEARLRSEALEAEQDDGKSANAADRLRALIEDRKQEQKRNLQQELTLDTFHPSEIFIKAETELENLRLYCLDRNHNAVIRINRQGEVKWHYGFEMGQKLSRPFDVSESKRTLLVSDTGHNRILELSKADKDVILELTGPKDSPLSGPRSAMRTRMGRTLIADQRNKRLVVLNSQGEMIWEFNKSGQISSPQYAEELENGNILFADTMLNSIREIDLEGNLIWSFGSRSKGNGPGQLFAPEFATRLPSGNTLIADTRNNRVLEVTLEGREIWIFTGDPKSHRKIMNPVRANRLENGNTQIIYNNHREIIEVTPDYETLWYFKMGNDVFLPAVHGEARGLKQMVEKLTSYYNPIEKRLLRTAQNNQMLCLEAHITLMDHCQMKSVRASLILMHLENAGTVIKTFPSPEELLADKFGKFLIIAVVLNPDMQTEALTHTLLGISEIEHAQLTPIQLDEAPLEMLNI